MRKNFLKESLYDYKDYATDMSNMIKKCLTINPEEEYNELGVFLGFLKALGIVHQSHHWQTLGKEFYGDHLLYERLYNNIIPEIDSLAEKIVGLGGIRLTNYFAQLEIIKIFLDGVAKNEKLIIESNRAELMFLVAGEIIFSILESKGILTRGLEQSIGNILDLHESHLYLIQQRNVE